jgi:hypothetical protein
MLVASSILELPLALPLDTTLSTTSLAGSTLALALEIFVASLLALDTILSTTSLTGSTTEHDTHSVTTSDIPSKLNDPPRGLAELKQSRPVTTMLTAPEK